LAPSPPTDFSSQALPWQRQQWHSEPQVHHQARQGSVGVLPERCMQNLCQGGHNDFFRSTFEETRDITTQCTTSYEVYMLCPA
jgi:hypothetical protein